MSHGTGGTVSPSSGWYNASQQVSISASPSSCYTFSSWSGSGSGSYSGSNNPATVTINGNISETASFSQKQYALTMGVSPPAGESLREEWGAIRWPQRRFVSS
ncbi:MAG: hypothetical protein QXV32_02075 [Conexivisphaerales archaeon]